jgi:probable addiction module antidote protein
MTMVLKTTKFDIQDHLKTLEDQIAYLEAAVDEDDPSFIATALGDIAKARGISKFAEEAGLSRETIYKSFRPGGNPTIETVNKATRALGLKLKLTPAKAA